MSFIDKLRSRLIDKKLEVDNKLYKIKVESEQQRAKKVRDKKQFLKPGTISYGLHYRQNPFDFAKDVIERRRNDRMLKNEDSRKS